MDERRRYFRIIDTVILNYKVVSKQERDMGVHELNAGIRKGEISRSLHSIETQIQGVMSHFREVQPEMAYIIKLLNLKINILKNSVKIPEMDKAAFSQQPMQELSLSACGISFESNQALEIGAWILLELVLCPSYYDMLIYGRVVLCEQMHVNEQLCDCYKIAIDFTDISEDDREKLIKHILQKQSEHLKLQRQLGTAPE